MSIITGGSHERTASGPLFLCRLSVPFFPLALSFLLATAAPALATEHPVPVSNANELRNALANAQDGDVIELADGTYSPGGTRFAVPFFKAAFFTIRAAHPGAAVIDGGPSTCSSDSRLFAHQVPDVTVVFEGLVFRDGCTTVTGTSGGIDIRGGAYATFVDCQFLNNSARPAAATGSSSGAVLVTGSSNAQFVGCEFTGNTSDSHGGAMLVGQGSTVFIHDSTFTGNRNNISGHRANGLGGAIHVFNTLAGSNARLFVSNSRFGANESAFVGGAIMAKGSFSSPVAPVEVVIANSTFVGNLTDERGVATSSPLEGGAVMVENNVSLKVYYSRFRNNSSELGGAISSYRGTVFVRSSEFRDNVAGGQGGAIKAHSNDTCPGTNYPSASVHVADSFFEGNSAQFGGAVFVAGDTAQMGYTGAGCSNGTLSQNRAAVTLRRSTFHGNSVDNTLADKNALGGAFYGNLVDATIDDSLFLDSSATATYSSVTIGGGAAAFLLNSKIRVTASTFARNAATGNGTTGEGGALYLRGGEIASFSGNVFFENAVDGSSVTASRGAAIFTRPETGYGGIEVTGAATNSIFTDNDGTPIFEADNASIRNRLTYSGNEFHNTRFGSDVFVNTLIFQGWTVSELNTGVVNGIDKGASNANRTSTIATAALLATPPQILPAGASGDPAGATEAFLAWAWSGGCATLTGVPSPQPTGFSSLGIGSRTLGAFDSGACSGGVDASDTASISNAGGPAGSLVANPEAISSGFSSTLSWSLSGAPFLAGAVTHHVSDALASGSGTQSVMPSATTRYRLFLLTEEGGVVQEQGVFVDEPPDSTIFTDGFESGSTTAWN